MLGKVFWLRRITNESCDQAIRHWFGPYAAELVLKLDRVNLGVPWVIRKYGEDTARKISNYDEMLYEIPSQHFTLRVRSGVGPWTERERTSLVVTIVPSASRSDKWEDITNETGVSLIALYYDQQPTSCHLADRRDFWLEARRLTELAGKYCTPFLMGRGEEYPKIRQFLEMRKREGKVEIERLLANLPPYAKQMWQLEGESTEEWQERLRRAAKEREPKANDQ